MHQAIKTVFAVADEVVKQTPHVTIDYDRVAAMAEELKSSDEVVKMGRDKVPACCDSDADVFDYELIANSVNYCYWYGFSTVRPNDANANMMYKLLGENFKPGPSPVSIFAFRQALIHARFPLIDRRLAHLQELLPIVGFIYDGIGTGMDRVMDKLVMIPGYTSDIFLKRASLFCMQINRKLGIWDNEVGELPIPADYQVPKMLRHYGILRYSDDLSHKVDNQIHLGAMSAEEVSIRAATIVAGREIVKLSGRNTSQVDYWLWLNRKKAIAPFHLTVTTDY